MPDFETKEELFKVYDDALEKLAEINEAVNKATSEIAHIFTKDVKYVDVKGETHISPGMDPKNPKFSGPATAFPIIFERGNRIIHEATRGGSAGNLMMWYARFRGISVEELTELGKHPDSKDSLKTKEKLNGIKQDYVDLINSDDPEKLAGFYMDIFSAFKKDSKTILSSGKLDSFVKNWPSLVMWQGVSGVIQQSFQREKQPMNDGQKQLVNLLNEKIKAAYGDDMALKDITAAMQPIHRASVLFASDLDSKESVTKFKNDAPEQKAITRSKIADAVRCFNVLENLKTRKQMLGEPVKYFSKDFCQAALIVSGGTGYGESVPQFSSEDEEDIYIETALDPEGPLYEDQMRYLAGDDSHLPLYDLSHATGYQDVAKDDPLTIMAGLDDMALFCDKTQFNKIVSPISHGDTTIEEIVSQKVKSKTPLNLADMASYLSSDNPSYTKEMKAATKAFFNMDPAFRMNKLPQNLKAVLTEYCGKQFGITPQEYISGVRPVSKMAEQQYKAQIKGIAKNKTADTVNVEYHKQMMGLFKNQMNSVSSTIASSKEFVEMEKAFKDLISKDPDYPKGREAEYKAKLATLKEKAAKYVTAKNADGKTERATGRGQKRLNIAKRLEAFASESLNQIQKAEDALLLANNPAEIKNEIGIGNFNKYVDEMLAPHAKGSPDLIAANVYTDKPAVTHSDNHYIPKDITLPENCPFSDHEFAMISYAELSNINTVKKGFRYNEGVTDEINTLQAYTFSHDDIFIGQRSSTKNDVPLFNIARESAEGLVKKYMEGDPQPLAESLKHQLDVASKHIRALATVDGLMNTHINSARQVLDILYKDPKLMKASGITGKDIKEIYAREAQMKFENDKILAQKSLKENPNMTPAEKEKCMATIVASQVLNAAELAEQDKMNESPEYLETYATFSSLGSQIALNKKIIDNSQNGINMITMEKKQELETEIANMTIQKDLAFSKLDILNSFRQNSKLFESFGDPANYELNKKAYMASIKQSPAFKEMLADPKKLSDEKLMGKIKTFAESKIQPFAKKIALKQGENAEKKLEQKQPQLEAPRKEEPSLGSDRIQINLS